jgi:hypothetical protein
MIQTFCMGREGKEITQVMQTISFAFFIWWFLVIVKIICGIVWLYQAKV